MTRPTSFQFRFLTLALSGAALTACSGGLDGGSILGSFNGINSAVVLGPETVEVSWVPSTICNSYKIFQLSSSTSEAVATVSVPPVKIKQPIIQSDRSYTFAVGCVDSTGQPSGLNFTKNFVTWAKFSGIVTSSLDTTGTNPLIDLKWNYASNLGATFEIYSQVSSVPGDLGTWGLTQPGGYGTQYSETPICQTYTNEIKIGPGTSCNPPGLTPGSIYNFKIVAKYPDNTHSSDIVGNGTSILIPSSFTAPDCILTREGLGADPSNSYLFLRCSSTTSAGGCPMASISTTAYQAVNGVRTVVSDTLNGSGTLRIQPKIAVNAANDRLVQNLEIEYVCKSSTPYTKAIARYDGSTTQLTSPSLKYGSTGYETAPVQAYVEHPSYLGGSVAIGDFNCDGKPDMAVGLPRISYTAAPYLNQNSESGAVKVYYDYAISDTGAITSASSQYLSFRDLPTNAHFGQSMSVGNVNKDVHFDSSAGKFFACDDLIIGAPGTGAGGYSGQAYIFYGQPQRFPQPLDSAALATNAPTCSGTILNQVCSPVKLLPNMSADYRLNPSETNVNNTQTNQGAFSTLGASVAYIRDFNADGYGDVAIGDPHCRWDGESMNNYIPPGTIAVAPPTDVGCVYVYWGGPSGLQSINVGNTPEGATALNASYAKIYPPIPQAGMHFGSYISGGGDVDGRLPVPVPQNGGSGVILASGDDFIVGAPDFKYSNSSPELGPTKQLAWTVDESTTYNGCNMSSGGPCPVDPTVLQGPPGYNDVINTFLPKVTPPWNGAWAPTGWNTTGIPTPANGALNGSSGIAFLYLGRSSYRNYDLALITNSSSPTINLSRYPNGVSSAPTTPIEQLLSLNLRDRQNGSQYLTTKNPITWQTSPTSSFYNCGNRGGPKNPDGSGTYKHISCFAGRNNFSVVYPTLSPTGSSVGGFGANLAIGGTKEQNAVALYQLGSTLSASAYKSTTNANLLLDLNPLAQGNTHERIRGSSIWELGVTGLNISGAQNNTCETTTDPNTTQRVDATCAPYAGRLARSIVDESYSFPVSSWNPAPNALPLTDINKDGYADIVVSANNQVFTYFGNYAADFSYQGNNVSTSATCSVNRVNAGLTSGFSTSKPASAAPYSTFASRASVMNVSGTYSYTVTGQYPQFVLPSTGNYSRLSYLDDTTESSGGIDYGYQTVTRSTQTNFASSVCLPQVKNYTNTPTSIAAADLNNDGIIDVAVGFSGFNNSSGQQIATIAGQTGNGLALDLSYTVNASSARLGSAVAATNWKFADETSRRDIASGAVGYTNGQGAVYTFSGANSASINPIYSYMYSEDSNTPSALSVERSKIVGDLNGDGYDDLFVPVKRFGAGGIIYYDALIYYGSSFGPVTYSFCISKLSTIQNLGGSSISAADCKGSATPQVATLAGAQIRLPQYITRPSGVGPSWAKGVFAAGDVNRDGYQDILSLDGLVTDDVGATPGSTGLFLFFGSSSGLINGPPTLGPSTNQSPQLVTARQDFISTGANSGSASWAAQNSVAYLYNLPQSTYPIVHGDFNGDGFEDLAIGMPGGSSPATLENPSGGVGHWTCNSFDAGYRPGYCYYVGVPPATFPQPSISQGISGVGYVMVFYGSSGGYQSPSNPVTGVATDYESIGGACFNNYSSCKYNATGTTSLSTISSVYNTLGYNSGSNQYTLNTALTACDSGSGLGNTAYTCKASMIRNPVFTNSTNGSIWDIPKLAFGSTLTVADVNHDGIDDLVIGQPQFDLTALSNVKTGSPPYASTTLYAGIADTGSHGAAFIFYGAKGAGVVAPDPIAMLGDAGLGTSGALATPSTNAVAFQLYPFMPGSAPLPPLETSGNGRNFATGMSTGDFNGDGYDDLAIVSAHGQVYVYYGPICQADNAKSNWQVVYANSNIAKPYDALNLDPPPSPSTCTLINLNGVFPGNTTTNLSNVSSFVKTLHPQMITVPGSNPSTAMGSILVSARPTRSVASTIALKNPGNINGDPEKTSDLVLGTSYMNDPNSSAVGTGLGYVFFGHKTPSAGDMSTTPGLYVSSTATYNGNITSQVVAGNTYYYYTPIILKPHASDGSIGSFFQYGTTLGDVNGDGTGDLMMTTKKVPYGADGTTVIDGGGFKLFY